MRVLLDTHTWIWWLSTPEHLNAEARSLLADRTNELVLSVGST